MNTSEPASLALLHVHVEEMEEENQNLRIALASRIVIEQAKGVLIERLDLPPEAVFELLRSAARRSRRKVHEIASEVLETRVNPDYIEREIRHLLAGTAADDSSRTDPREDRRKPRRAPTLGPRRSGGLHESRPDLSCQLVRVEGLAQQ